MRPGTHGGRLRYLAVMAPTTARRLAAVGGALLWDLALPLAVTVALILVLTDARLLDTTELRANSMLMNARPIFRTVAPEDQLRVALGDSAILLSAAMLGALVVALPAAIVFSTTRPGALRAAVWSFATFAASLPAFFWAIVLSFGWLTLAVTFGLPFLPVAGFGVDEHLVLPAVALGLRPAAYVFRLSTIAIDEVRHRDFVRTGTAKGLRERDVLVRHVLPNAAPSIVASVVLATRSALSSLVIVEYVYIWGGAGTLFVQSLGRRELDLATQLAVAFAVATALLTFAAHVVRERWTIRS